MAKAFARLLSLQRSVYPFRIVAAHTLRHGTAYDPKGLPFDPPFGPPATSVDDFLDHSRADVAIELTTLNPETGEPAASHLSAAIGRGMHAITANKGSIAHAYAKLCEQAKQAHVEFRFESIVMDGAPVFNTLRNNLPGVKVLGFTGVLNSTSNLVIDAMERGLSMEQAILEAQRIGIAEANPFYDLDGWDSAVKTAALANVLMNADTNPKAVRRAGVRDFTPERIRELADAGQTVRLVSRAERSAAGNIQLQVQPEVMSRSDLLAAPRSTSNLLLFHTDLMGTIGTISLHPGIEQTAYGLFSDLVEIARSV